MNTMKALIATTALSFALVGGVLAQPGPYGGMAGTQVRISSWSDRGAYYVQVVHGGAGPEVLTRIHGRRLEVVVRQQARGPGGFMTGGAARTCGGAGKAGQSRPHPAGWGRFAGAVFRTRPLPRPS